MYWIASTNTEVTFLQNGLPAVPHNNSSANKGSAKEPGAGDQREAKEGELSEENHPSVAMSRGGTSRLHKSCSIEIGSMS